MQTILEGSSAFRYVRFELSPGDRVISEAGAMASMDAEIDITARLFGGLFGAVSKKLLGGESLFINEYSNDSDQVASLTISSGFPGDTAVVELKGNSLVLQPGAFLASTLGLDYSVEWAGITYWLAGEGLFSLRVSGVGFLWMTAYGALVKKEIDGEYVVDTGHLVAYDSHLSLSTGLSGGLFSSAFGGEGIITRVKGKGTIYLQTRSIKSFTGWLIPRL